MTLRTKRRAKIEGSYKLQVTGYKLQVTGYKLQVTGYKLQVTGYKLQVTGYKLQVTGYKLQVTRLSQSGRQVACCKIKKAKDKKGKDLRQEIYVVG